MSYPLVLILIIESGGRCVCVCVGGGGGGGGGVVLFCPMVRFSDFLMKSSTSYRNVHLE